MNLSHFIVGLAIFTCANAQVISLGRCPDVKTQPTFDINQYLGSWYEIYKFYAIFERNQKCVVANYRLKDDGHIRVDNMGMQDGKFKEAIGDAYTPNSNEPAKLAVRFSDFAPYGDYWVIDTDYKNYTMIYSCGTTLGFIRTEFAWILSRTRTLNDDIKNKLFAEAESYGINTSHFSKEDQTNC